MFPELVLGDLDGFMPLELVDDVSCSVKIKHDLTTISHVPISQNPLNKVRQITTVENTFC